jgi:hypothetical protein
MVSIPKSPYVARSFHDHLNGRDEYIVLRLHNVTQVLHHVMLPWPAPRKDRRNFVTSALVHVFRYSLTHIMSDH